MKVYVIGSISQIEEINEHANRLKYYGFDVEKVTKSDKPLKDLVKRCYTTIKRAEVIYVVKKPDGSIGDGVTYEVGFAEALGKTIVYL